MSQGLPAYTSVGTGTLTFGTGNPITSITITPNASTLQGDLVVGVVYTGESGLPVDSVVDGGDGWVFLHGVYSTANNFCTLLIACIAPRNGSAGYAGLLPVGWSGATAFSAQVQTYRVAPPARFHLGGFARAPLDVVNAGSGTALDAPAINQPSDVVIDLVGRGYSNAGTTTTVANITNFTERFDTGNATSQGSIVLNDRTAVINGSVQNASVTSALSVAKTLRAGCRAMIPIIGHVGNRNRYMSYRRIG